jgi:hypothetical protein
VPLRRSHNRCSSRAYAHDTSLSSNLKRADYQRLQVKVHTLELAFDSKSLRTLCGSFDQAKRVLGTEVAETLKRRLADMRAATSPADLIAGRPRRLEGFPQQMIVDLRAGYIVVFCANHSRNPITDGGDLDWARISRIKLLRIESPHE